MKCKLGQPWYKTVWWFLRKLKIELPYNLAILFLGKYPYKTKIQKETCILRFITELFIIRETWKQPKCLSTDEWIREIWYVQWNTAAANSLQSCPTLCDPIDSSPPGSPIPGILQARTLEWVAISFSNVWKWKVRVKSLSRDWLLVIPWTTAYQAPPPMGFSRQEYWSGVPMPSPQWNTTQPLKRMKQCHLEQHVCN